MSMSSRGLKSASEPPIKQLQKPEESSSVQ
jgi:hypothetical protein